MPHYVFGRLKMRSEVLCGLTAALLYVNTLPNDFVYDDRKAVLSHPSVVGSAPLATLLERDYWGVPLSHPGSHKSYRPLTTLSFRLDWLAASAGRQAFQFHLTNILLHAAVTALFVTFCRGLVTDSTARLAGLLFAVHPVHSEAVAGVAGRADILAGVFYLTCLIVHRRRPASLAIPLLAAAAMLAKEQGITVLGICAIMEVATCKRGPSGRHNLAYLGLSTLVLLSLRSLALDSRLPSFSRSDNPAARSDSAQTRTLTFLHLPVLNWQLLACPARLSYDWSMDAVPLVTSLLDCRNMISMVFYTVLTYSLFCQLSPLVRAKFHNKSYDLLLPLSASEYSAPVVLVSLLLIILPFLPATNLFFYVGFVLAERVLYLPSLGYCLLLAVSLRRAARYCPRAVSYSTTALLLLLSFRTLSRNADWSDEKTLFLSGVRVNPAKSWSNLGSVLNSRGDSVSSELVLKQALLLRPNMADSHYNLGVLLQGQGRLTEAAAAYRAAIRYRPQLGLAYLNLGTVYTDLDQSLEAAVVLRSCSRLDDTDLKDPRGNTQARISCQLKLGRLLLQEGDVTDALAVLEAALEESLREGGQHMEAILNGLGDCHQARGGFEEAEYWYSRSLAVNPAHLPAHLTLAKMLAKNDTRKIEAENWFRRAIRRHPQEAAAAAHFGLFLMDSSRHQEAVTQFKAASDLQPDSYEYVFNLAVAAREAGQLDLAERSYRAAVRLRPSESESHGNLGALLHLRGRLREAEAEYLIAWRLRPGDSTTRTNILRLHRVMQSQNVVIQPVDL